MTSSIGGVSSFKPIAAKSGVPISDAVVQKHLASPGIKAVLDALDINPKNIVQLQKAEGAVQTHLTEIQVLPVTPEIAEMLKSLAINENVELVLVVETFEDLKKIQKKLADIKSSTFNQAEMEKLLTLLGLDAKREAFVFYDEIGGLCILKESLGFLT
ncbi:hypothetical protein ACFL96_01960 [Thermoproteota archaeon]